jgi:hypothetical protein
MTDRISILALGTAEENAAIRMAMMRISEAAIEAGGPAFDVATAALSEVVGVSVDLAIASMLPEAEADEEPWTSTERKLGNAIAGLSQNVRKLYICTVFRHATGPDWRARLARIRKLNLLALELSRETGAFIIDVDRMLADAGARSFHTDFRLTGPLATEAVAREIVSTLVATGFGSTYPRPARERLSALLDGWRPPRVTPQGTTPRAWIDTRARNVRAIGGAFSSPEDSAVFALRRLVRGQISLSVGFELAARMIRKHGVKSAMITVWRSARRLLGRPRPT